MKLKMFHDNVLIERDETEEKKSPGGIVLVKTAQQQPDTGIVLCVGPGRVLDGTVLKPSVSKGDRVLFGKYAGTELVVGDDKCLVIPWSDILGMVVDDG